MALVERLRGWQRMAPVNSIDIDILTREAADTLVALQGENEHLWAEFARAIARAEKVEAEMARLTKLLDGART